MLKYALLTLVSLAIAIPSNAQRADDYKVNSLPGLSINTLNVNQYAGHIEVNAETEGHLFFWMVEQSPEAQAEKLIIWLNGGPGCSSMDGLFLENGPFRVNSNLSLSINDGGWQDQATIVFLDQPVGTGFSFAHTNGYMTSMTEITENFLVFLSKFFDIFPDLKDRDLYLAGESFAGTYIPYFATRILKHNKESNGSYNLKGIAIGNGWISPKHQYRSLYDFAVLNDLFKDEKKESALKYLQQCNEELENHERISIPICDRILHTILESSMYTEDGQDFCMNQYDIRLKDEDESCGMTWPHELTSVTSYLRQKLLTVSVNAVLQQNGWTECTTTVSSRLKQDESEPAYNLLPSILQEIPVLLFSGDQDLTCNTLGTKYLINNMTWNGAKGWKEGISRDWYIDNVAVGTVTEARNLSFVIIYGGSHMVPYDKPIEALVMINRFMGVGGNKVKGKISKVGEGDAPVVEGEGSPGKENDEESNPKQSAEDTNGTDEIVPNQNENDWSQYYSWGVWALIVMILFAGITGYCCYRSRKQNETGYRRGTRRSSRSRSGVINTVLGILGKRRRKSRPTLRLDDNDDTNELDELVIQTPTLFAAEEFDDELQAEEDGRQSPKEQISKGPVRFAITDADDDYDDDFDDIDQEQLVQRHNRKPY